MTWDQVPAKLAEYDAMEYADNSGNTSASRKLLVFFKVFDVLDVPAEAREDFEAQLDYRMGACLNLAKSRAVHPKLLD